MSAYEHLIYVSTQLDLLLNSDCLTQAGTCTCTYVTVVRCVIRCELFEGKELL